MVEFLSDHGIPDEMWQQQFAAGVRSPFAWSVTAQSLRRSADILGDHIVDARRRDVQRVIAHVPGSGPKWMTPEEREDFDLGRMDGIYLMLSGFAVENLLKGLIVARDVGRGALTKFPPDLGTHNLRSLADRLDLQFDPEQTGVLRVLEESAVWGGRYPVPKNWEALRPLMNEEGKPIQPTVGLVEYWRPRVDTIYGFLHGQLMDTLTGRTMAIIEAIERADPSAASKDSPAV